jgi:cell pole-organizing protein PopZ
MTHDEAPEQDEAPEPVVVSRKKKPKKSHATTFAVLALIAAAVAAVYEHQRAENLTAALAQANARSEQIQQRMNDQTQELKTVASKFEELARKNLPVSVVFRPAVSGNGLTTYFKNNAPSPIEISVILTNPITDRRREVNLNLPANGVQSIGEPEGWVFVPGHHIKLTHAQFGTVEYVVTDK